MTRLLAGVAAVALLVAGQAGGSAIGGPVPGGTGAPPAIRLPGFAPRLADRPLVEGPPAWPRIADRDAWAAIARSTPATRQEARWAHAVSLIGTGRGADALGVLDVMATDDPDLALVPGWQRARGAALVQVGHLADAAVALGGAALARDPEACLWRLRGITATDPATDAARRAAGVAALAQIGCAAPALDARGAPTRRPFVLAAARAALMAGRPAVVAGWLAGVPDGDPEANLLRGKADLAMGRAQEGRLRLSRVGLTGSPVQRADATVSAIEAGVAGGTLTHAAAAKRLDRFRLGWRGDGIERRALLLALRSAESSHDIGGALAAGAMLFRYHDLGADTAALATRLQAKLAEALTPASTLPLDRAAGLFWDYRDLAPAGAGGVRLVERLVARLEAAGLYGRAADLLGHMLAAAQDIEQGPLSVRVASLRILAGDPAAAVRVLRETDAYPYPADMAADRRRVEAAALDLLGKPAEAVAALSDVPDGEAVSAEIWWRARDWQQLVAIGEPALPAAGRLNAVGQATVLRHAIALAMLGREDALARLRDRYQGAFATLATAPAFRMLTADPAGIDPAALAGAMAALPTASPAGDFADLLDQGSAAMAPAG